MRRWIIFILILTNCSSDFGFDDDKRRDQNGYSSRETPENDPFRPVLPQVNLPVEIPKIDLPIETNINVWLGKNITVAEHLVWYEEPGGWVSWPNWSSGLKNLLQDAYIFALMGTSVPMQMPPENHVKTKDGEAPISILSFEDARNIFFSQVAWNILIDVQKLVPWQISDLSEKELSIIFDGRTDFEEKLGCTYPNGSFDSKHVYCTFKGIKINNGGLTPAQGHWTYGLLLANNLIGKSRERTIELVCRWISQNFGHMTGPNKTYNVEKLYNYRGLPPIVNMVEGEPFLPDKGLRAMYACWGATQFLKLLLGQVNIPVQTIDLTYHRLPYFSSEGLALDHGDALYSSAFLPYIPNTMEYREIFINESVFQAWFGDNVSDNEKLNNVGRRGREINLKYLNYSIISLQCQDLKDGKSIPESEVYKYFKNEYTLQELGEMKLWQQLDEKLKTMKYDCDELYKYIFDYYGVEY